METIKVRITTPTATVEVEAPADKIEEAVKNVLNALKTAEPQPTTKPTPPKKLITCRKAVEELVNSGWLKTGRNLSEVVAELERRGFLYDTTAVAHVLLDLVRLGLLERVGEPRKYVYIQPAKRPEPSSQMAEDSTR
ncbi:MAG: hypothetical protein RMH74_08765 [Candidatus Caldarchaeum sp.]|nr:hypothetical protein [Candidatus Caldarchaeum sp.]